MFFLRSKIIIINTCYTNFRQKKQKKKCNYIVTRINTEDQRIAKTYEKILLNY